jgi:hypothetical protein
LPVHVLLSPGKTGSICFRNVCEAFLTSFRISCGEVAVSPKALGLELRTRATSPPVHLTMTPVVPGMPLVTVHASWKPVSAYVSP